MDNNVTMARDYLKNDILDPLARLYGELESTGKITCQEELEVVLVKLNKAVKQAN